MKSLIIVRPYSATYNTGTGTAVANVLTANPKEASVATGTTWSATIDFGVSRSVDAAFVGYTNLPTGASATFYVGDTLGTITSSPLGTATVDTASDVDLPRHLVTRRDAGALSGRYMRVDVTGYSAALPTFGVVAAGFAWSCQWGYEVGAGRSIGDTGSSERLLSGALAIEEGVTFTGFKWTFGDLQEAERESLYKLLRKTGETKTALVVEDYEATAGLNDRIHWGLMKIEPYERVDPLNTRWGLQILDWA